MRVLAMVAAYPPQQCVGSWMMTHGLLRALTRRGHHVDVVLTLAEGEPYELDGVAVWPHRHKSDPFGFVSDAHVIVSHLEGGSRAAVIAQMSSVPIVQIVHNLQGRYLAHLQRSVPNLLVCNSQHVRDQLAGMAPRLLVVRPPVDAADYATKPAGPDGAITLINLSADKGAEVFYALAERLPDRRFLGVTGGYGHQIIRDLPNVDIIDHVPAHQMRDHVYARTRVLLMPSAHESWGRTGVEAMHSGIPVLAHPTDGLRESLGPAGIFIDRGDINGWAAELTRLQDGRKWRAASTKSKARAAALDPSDDLDTWCDAVEGVARVIRARVS